MATDHIVSLLLIEREKIDQAIKALGGTKAEPILAAPKPVEPPATPAKRKLSAAGRQAIIAATKKRWAAIKAAKAAPPVPVVTPSPEPKAAPASNVKTSTKSVKPKKKAAAKKK